MIKEIFVLLLLVSILKPADTTAMSLMDTLVQKEITGYRQDKWCEDHGGQARRVLADQTRIDCLTDTHAVKFELAPNWDRAIGQALFYGLKTGKRPGLVLIFENAEDDQHWLRMDQVLKHYRLPIDVWQMRD